MSEHYLQSYSRLLDLLIESIAEKQSASPLEIVDRIDVGYDVLAAMGWPENQLLALLTIAIDRLATQQVGAK